MNIRPNLLARALAVSAAIALAACHPSANNSATVPAATADKPAADASRPPASVDGQPITRDMLDFVARNNAGKKFDDLIRIQLLANAAVRKGKDKDPDIVQALALGRLNVLMQSTITDYIKDKEPTEQDVRAYYEERIKEAPQTWYRVRVIAVATQPYAEDIVKELKKGGDFITIARREASGDAAKQAAGDSGWFSLDNVPPALANAVSSLKVGEYTASPVQLPDGWGIVRLEQTRPADKPEFDKVRQALTRELISKKVDALVEELKKTAKIERATGAGG
jgi:peptidyl-prolyl cis-trans isomerase C